MENGIIVGEKMIRIPDVRVRTWHDTGLQFRAGEGFNKRRHQDINLMVWHWTGGEGEPSEIFKTLKKRELGVEFAIARTGDIWQFCDPLIVDTADAGSVNARSIGCEMVCYGIPSALTLWRPPKLGRDREIYEDQINGKTYKIGWFYPAQIKAALALADALTGALPRIERRVPEISPRVLLPTELKAFAGHLGHYHVSQQKQDPGPRLIERLYDHFRETEITARLSREPHV